MILKLFYGTLWSIFLAGCLTTPKQVIVPESQEKVEKNSKDIKKQEAIIEQQKYKKCEEHRRLMNYAFSYVITEFDKGYFEYKNIVGAKAQLFLIQNRSQSLFAKNINDAENSYRTEYLLAKKEECDLKDFSISPITKVKKTIKALDDELSL